MREHETFAGFPTSTQATPVPEAFFAEILPHLTRLAEIKLFLVALRRIRHRKGAIRSVTARDLAAAPELGTLTESVNGQEPESPESRQEIIERVMAAFVKAGVCVEVSLADDNVAYFMNDAEGRRAAERVSAGGTELSPVPSRSDTEEPVTQPGEIFRLYEDTIGPLPGAGIAEELKEAEVEYPASLIREAFHEAAAQNVRRWAYVRAILRNRRDRGVGDGTTQRRPAKDRYREGKYGKIVRWR